MPAHESARGGVAVLHSRVRSFAGTVFTASRRKSTTNSSFSVPSSKNSSLPFKFQLDSRPNVCPALVQQIKLLQFLRTIDSERGHRRLIPAVPTENSKAAKSLEFLRFTAMMSPV